MARLTALLSLVLCASCVSVQDFRGSPPAPDSADAGADAASGADGGPASEAEIDAKAEAGTLPPVEGTLRWEWANPSPTGKSLYGIGGTSENDVWVAGDGGTISHFNGTRWDIRHRGSEATRYFAVGTSKPKDVWVAGDTGGQISVVHFDGSTWVDSYPFAGSAFGAFSHGPGQRLFVVTDWDILELSATGTWVRTDTKANDVFGPPRDVWVAASGEAWAITSGAKLLHLPAASQKWELLAPPAGVPQGATGLSISGTGSTACAFYTGRFAGAGVGYLHYDGHAWSLASSDTDPLTLDDAPHGSRSACLADGSGVLTYGGNVITASAGVAPSMHMPTDFPGEKLFGAWSLDGSKVTAVGTLGAFITRSSGATTWQERGPSLRKDLLAVDVGLDGVAIAVDALQPTRSSGGDVLVWEEGWRKTHPASGLLGPSIPAGVAVIRSNDAWVVSSDSSRIGVAHWTGSWGLTRFLGQTPLQDALAIWAPAKNDVWVTGRAHCPDFDPPPNDGCSKPRAGVAWHYDGTAWTEVAVDGAYRAIHGTGPSDVWFAGEGVAHWDGKALTAVAALKGTFAGVWSSAPDRVWLWGDRALLYDGKTSTPVKDVLHASAEWEVAGIAESTAGDVFVLTKRAAGTSLLWFDPSHTRLVEQLSSDLELTAIRGRGNQLWAIGMGGASLHFSAQDIH